MNPSDEPDERDDEQRGWAGEELERASENVLGGWPSAQLEDPPPHGPGPVTAFDSDKAAVDEPGPVAPPEPEPDAEPEAVGVGSHRSNARTHKRH